MCSVIKCSDRSVSTKLDSKSCLDVPSLRLCSCDAHKLKQELNILQASVKTSIEKSWKDIEQLEVQKSDNITYTQRLTTMLQEAEETASAAQALAEKMFRSTYYQEDPALRHRSFNFAKSLQRMVVFQKNCKPLTNTPTPIVNSSKECELASKDKMISALEELVSQSSKHVVVGAKSTTQSSC